MKSLAIASWHLGAMLALGMLASKPMASAADSDRGARFCRGRNIDCEADRGQAIRLARRWQPVAEWRFDRDPPDWQIKNYQKALKIEVVSDAGFGQHLFVHREEKEIDTAFELVSPPIPVVAGTLCRLTIAAAHTLDLSMARGHKDACQNQILWRDRDGRALGSTPFRFGAAGDSWYDVSVESRAPRGATTAVVQIGFDSPNLFGSRQFRLRTVVWTAQPDPPQHVTDGELISRPQRLAGSAQQVRLSWQADTPEGTSVKLQVRSAADDDGGPRDWTPFAGPDGTPESHFTSCNVALPAIHAGHPWLQYRLTLETNRDAATPVVRQVRLGDAQRWIEDHAWLGADTLPPRLVEYVPRRTSDPRQALVFSLSDGPDGVGVDRHSVEVLLDGTPFTGQLQHAGGPFRYEPREPLKPQYGLAAIEDWAVVNFNSALMIRRGPPRETVGNSSIEVRRQGEKGRHGLYLGLAARLGAGGRDLSDRRLVASHDGLAARREQGWAGWGDLLVRWPGPSAGRSRATRVRRRQFPMATVAMHGGSAVRSAHGGHSPGLGLSRYRRRR